MLTATPQLVKPNARESAEVTGRPIETVGDVTTAAELLRAQGLGTVLVSLGRDGAVLVDGNGALHGRTAAVDVINTVGAGDAFLAGYLAADATMRYSPQIALPGRCGGVRQQSNTTARCSPGLMTASPCASLRRTPASRLASRRRRDEMWRHDLGTAAAAAKCSKRSR